jgi:hypothetical protein
MMSRNEKAKAQSFGITLLAISNLILLGANALAEDLSSGKKIELGTGSLISGTLFSEYMGERVRANVEGLPEGYAKIAKEKAGAMAELKSRAGRVVLEDKLGGPDGLRTLRRNVLGFLSERAQETYRQHYISETSISKARLESIIEDLKARFTNGRVIEIEVTANAFGPRVKPPVRELFVGIFGQADPYIKIKGTAEEVAKRLREIYRDGYISSIQRNLIGEELAKAENGVSGSSEYLKLSSEREAALANQAEYKGIIDSSKSIPKRLLRAAGLSALIGSVMYYVESRDGASKSELTVKKQAEQSATESGSSSTAVKALTAN